MPPPPSFLRTAIRAAFFSTIRRTMADSKTAKEAAKEAAKAAKAAKFAAKQAAQKLQNAASGKSAAPSKKDTAAKSQLPAFVEDTPPGQKKPLRSFDEPHFTAYTPAAVEAGWYAWWEQSGFFKPQFTEDGSVKPKGKFVVALPPPNVTGALHCGHALANSLQDILVRWHRMQGYTTAWVPGCDHAGIATQSVVEKALWKREQKTRHDLGREKFVETVLAWKEDYHKRINNAQRKMGGSMDWSREAFTMDPNRSRATIEAFVRLHEDGVIYRSSRLVNWCTALNTALSTIEVKNKEIPGRTLLSVPGYDKKVEFGTMTYFKYPIEGSDETIEVATTRPETMLGDTGIAVHPQDTRYQHLVGKEARHPFIKDRLLRIVADEYVDPELGTGAVKLTPAHDPNDYKLGQTHNLEFINIFNDDGTLNENAGSFVGMKRFDARYAVVKQLEEIGLFVKKESHAMTIPLCERSNDVIEPLIKPQWWMRMRESADAALEAVRDGRITIAPEPVRRMYDRWLENISDWCLSRQLWWGHRIPAYAVIFEDEQPAQNDEEPWVVARSPQEAEEKAQKLYPGRKFRLEQDSDCLDTWFSSGIWPMSILGWPNTEVPDFKKLFPTSLLETGWDIIFFWVARMIMMSLKLTGQVPFTEVYCHSLVRDSEGRKMSKSLGNVIDPLDIIYGKDLEGLHATLLTGNLAPDEVEKAKKYQKTAFPKGIPECGADAMRFTLASYTTGGGDINFDIQVMHAYRRFCNKIWQASKYVLGRLPKDFVPQTKADLSNATLSEKWILHRLNAAVTGVNQALKDREFSRSTQFAYQFFYDELCDVFIENSKALLAGAPGEQPGVLNTLYICLDVSLRLMHPFMPFITEELWQRLPRGAEHADVPSIMLAAYPEANPEFDFPEAAKEYEIVLGCAKAARSLAAEYQFTEGAQIQIQATTPEAHKIVEAQAVSIRALSGKAVGQLEILPLDSAAPGLKAIFTVSPELNVLLDVAGKTADMDAEIEKLRNKLKKAQISVAKQNDVLGQPGFAEKVSETVKAEESKKLEEAESKVRNYERTIERFLSAK
ncbi:valyl-tRNA synthetase [Westerdykella ornata]|uniref:Valine--tRNA ligase, mitochondrial n=1 Tax=Westerdykella ornata TaxID=318751 RepID=A0A6A6JPP1_WESOR|nr:valyl-tRNA synthetase [Westerdykella ornata]KAF2278581.1 valyl-tRNA synthetase [Westerdykella ornata]